MHQHYFAISISWKKYFKLDIENDNILLLHGTVPKHADPERIRRSWKMYSTTGIEPAAVLRQGACVPQPVSSLLL